MALAVGAVVAGFFGIPAALGGGNAIEHFLEPSFTAHDPAAAVARRDARRATAAARRPAAEREEPARRRAASSCGLMVFSVLVAVVGIAAGVEVLRHEPGDLRAPRRAVRWCAPGAVQQVLRRRALQRDGDLAAPWRSGRGLWAFDRNVVDGVVNGIGLADDLQLVALGPDRSHRRRRPGEPRRAASCRRQLLVPPRCRPASCRTTRC